MLPNCSTLLLSRPGTHHGRRYESGRARLQVAETATMIRAFLRPNALLTSHVGEITGGFVIHPHAHRAPAEQGRGADARNALDLAMRLWTCNGQCDDVIAGSSDDR